MRELRHDRGDLDRDDPRLVLLLLRLSLARRLGDRPRGTPRSLEEAVRALEDDGGPAAALRERARAFPAPVPALLDAVERGADPDRCLGAAIDLLGERRRLRGRVRGALAYPALCLLAVVAVTVLFLALDPLWGFLGAGEAFETITTRETAGPRRALATALAPAPVRWGLVAALVAGPALALGRLAGRGGAAAARRRLDAPLLGRLERLSAAAGFARALAELLDAGLPVDRAIGAAIPAAGNAWVEERLRERLAGVVDGGELAEALALPGVFPASLRGRLRAGCREGALPDALRRAAAAYAADLELYGARVARLVEPLAILGVGVLAMIAVWIWMPAAADPVGLADVFGWP